jgi:hypothetical protein
MMSMADDQFLDVVHGLVQQAHTEHRSQIERGERARLERESRARELTEHVTRRFSAIAASTRGSDQGIQYTRLDAPEGEDLPVIHTLHWRVSQPHRTLEIRLSEWSGRYWIHLLAVDELSGEGRVVDQGLGNVMNMTIDGIDQLIRRLLDQRAWQGDMSADL